MICRRLGCSTRLTASQDSRGAYFCSPACRRASARDHKIAADAALRIDSLAVLRALVVAGLLADTSQVLALAVDGEQLLRPPA